MAKFPNIPAFTGFNTPLRFEGEILDLEVEGEFPNEIDGAFYRVQPDPQFPPPSGNDIAFNGDGAISMFSFRGGKVDFKQRWVRTDKFVLEREAERSLFGAYRNPLTDDESVKGRYRGTANTNVMGYGGVLYALKEDSPPVAMDPRTLETTGYSDFDGRMKSPTFTAHPKVDPVSGDMCGFGYAAKGLCTRDVAYYEIGPDGTVKQEVWFQVPYYCMVHDFGVTQDYVVFPVVPIVGSWERLEAGLPHFGWDTTKEIYLGVLKRDGSGEVRWFKGPNQFATHVMNAFNDGSKIYFDTPVAKNNMFPFFPDVHGAPFNPQESASFLTRWTVDMASNDDTFDSMERLYPLNGEFPRIDDRFATLEYRHGWMLVQDFSKPFETAGGPSATGMRMNVLAHVDHATGKEKTWWAGPATTLQEPAFIPKPGSTAEGEGYLVQVANRLDERRADLLVFDAMRVDEGPIGAAKLPMRLRAGLHGNYMSDAQMSGPAARAI